MKYLIIAILLVGCVVKPQAKKDKAVSDYYESGVAAIDTTTDWKTSDYSNGRENRFSIGFDTSYEVDFIQYESIESIRKRKTGEDIAKAITWNGIGAKKVAWRFDNIPINQHYFLAQ